MFIILLSAFVIYDTFSIIDITSFAVLTFASCLVLIPAVYLLVIGLLKKRVKALRQFIYFPVALVLIANLPAYYIIWQYTNDLYGRSEAFLFTIGIFVAGFVFGILSAWKCKLLTKA